MSAIDEIKKLEAKKKELLEQAKAEALEQAEEAVTVLNALGFPYKLTGGPKPQRAQRRAGIRDQVLTTVAGQPNGMSRADVIDHLQARGDKKAEQAISNALSALKREERITLTDGIYTSN